MWQILKSELKYHRNLILFPSLIVLAALVGNLIYSWKSPGTYLNGAIGSIIIVFYFFEHTKNNLDNKAKRGRFYAVLPLKLWQIGLSRLLFYIFVWSTFLGLFWLTSAFIRPYPASKMIWQMLSINGYMLALMTFSYIMNDIHFTFYTLLKDRLYKVIYRLIFGVIFIAYLEAFFFLLSIPGLETVRNQWIKSVLTDFIFFISNMQGAIIVNLIGLSFIMLNIFTFIKRKSYLQ